MALSLGPAIMELNWGNGSWVCALYVELVWSKYKCNVYMHVCGVHVTQSALWSMCASASATLSKFPGSLQCQDSGHHPLGRGLQSLIPIKLDNSIQLVVVLRHIDSF